MMEGGKMANPFVRSRINPTKTKTNKIKIIIL